MEPVRCIAVVPLTIDQKKVFRNTVHLTHIVSFVVDRIVVHMHHYTGQVEEPP